MVFPSAENEEEAAVNLPSQHSQLVGERCTSSLKNIWVSIYSISLRNDWQRGKGRDRESDKEIILSEDWFKQTKALLSQSTKWIAFKKPAIHLLWYIPLRVHKFLHSWASAVLILVSNSSLWNKSHLRGSRAQRYDRGKQNISVEQPSSLCSGHHIQLCDICKSDDHKFSGWVN